MSVESDLRSLGDYFADAPASFRKQISDARYLREKFGKSHTDDLKDFGKSVDRSQELIPIVRPTIVRTIVGL